MVQAIIWLRLVRRYVKQFHSLPQKWDWPHISYWRTVTYYRYKRFTYRMG